MGGPTIDFPTRKDVETMQVGDLAIDAFGGLSRVVRIAYRGEDLEGRAFVGYCTEFGDRGANMSMSRKEREVTRTVALSASYTSDEIRKIEDQLRREAA